MQVAEVRIGGQPVKQGWEIHVPAVWFITMGTLMWISSMDVGQDWWNGGRLVRFSLMAWKAVLHQFALVSHGERVLLEGMLTKLTTPIVTLCLGRQDGSWLVWVACGIAVVCRWGRSPPSSTHHRECFASFLLLYNFPLLGFVKGPIMTFVKSMGPKATNAHSLGGNPWAFVILTHVGEWCLVECFLCPFHPTHHPGGYCLDLRSPGQHHDPVQEILSVSEK